MMKRVLQAVVFWGLLTRLVGCSSFSVTENTPRKLLAQSAGTFSSLDKSTNTEDGQKTANPPAKTIRFDGHEIVLGQSESESLAPDKLISELETLLQNQRLHSASVLLLRHRESAERLLSERWATDANDVKIQFVAKVLSSRSTIRDKSWLTLVDYATRHPLPSVRYLELRNSFASDLQIQDPSDEAAEQLLQSSFDIAHPLVRIDALRLLGLRELVSGRYAWAESQFRQAIEIAINSGNPLIASELWLTLSETTRRGNQPSVATSAWTNAVDLHLASMNPDHPVDVHFWNLSEKTRPESLDWPAAITESFSVHAQQIGCTKELNCETILWSSVASAQLDRRQSQAALVNFKRAETLTDGDNVMWLRIAQSKCLAALGQVPAATAILSGPAAHSDSVISSAATATLGSIKLQAGAFQQGAQLLHKSLSQAPLSIWPDRAQALADLATAQLILGETESGLKALREAQVLLEDSGQIEALLRTMENEARLLEHENRLVESRETKLKMSRIEHL